MDTDATASAGSSTPAKPWYETEPEQISEVDVVNYCNRPRFGDGSVLHQQRPMVVPALLLLEAVSWQLQQMNLTEGIPMYRAFSGKFKKPVFAADLIHTKFQVTERHVRGLHFAVITFETYNQRDLVVVQGEMEFLILGSLPESN